MPGRREGEKPDVNQAFQRIVAGRGIESPESLRLIGRHAQAWHLAVLGANAAKQVVERSGVGSGHRQPTL